MRDNKKGCPTLSSFTKESFTWLHRSQIYSSFEHDEITINIPLIKISINCELGEICFRHYFRVIDQHFESTLTYKAPNTDGFFLLLFKIQS